MNRQEKLYAVFIVLIILVIIMMIFDAMKMAESVNTCNKVFAKMGNLSTCAVCKLMWEGGMLV